MFWNVISGPVIGAVIGYCTNYLAVKMLFYPRKEVRIGSFKLPFTPGVIPKGKPRLAAAIGDMVGKTLITQEDIAKKLLSSELEELAADRIMGLLSGTLKEELLRVMPEESYEEKRQKLSGILCEQTKTALDSLPIGPVIAQEGQRIILEKVQGTFLAMMISEELIQSLIGPVGQEIQEYVKEHSTEFLEPVLEEKLGRLEQCSGEELLEHLDLSKEQIREGIKQIYRRLVKNAADTLLNQMDLSRMAADKINGMEVLELEKLVLSVMKKELDIIVRLGAVIGFLLGLLNNFF